MIRPKKKAAFRIALDMLVKSKCEFSRQELRQHGWPLVAPLLEQLVGMEPGETTPKNRGYKALAKAGKWDKAIPSGLEVKAPPKTKTATSIDPVRAFYRSYEWRQLRMQILTKYGARCMCCGATAECGAQIHVDHIKPVRFFWTLRLDPNNLQVLCGECNHGKGNWDRTDWRPAEKQA